LDLIRFRDILAGEIGSYLVLDDLLFTFKHKLPADPGKFPSFLAGFRRERIITFNPVFEGFRIKNRSWIAPV
jgi:hypothetical protein